MLPPVSPPLLPASIRYLLVNPEAGVQSIAATGVYAQQAVVGVYERVGALAQEQPVAFAAVVGSVVAASVVYDALCKRPLAAVLMRSPVARLFPAEQREENLRFITENLLHPGRALMLGSAVYALGELTVHAPASAEFQGAAGDFLVAGGMILLVRWLERHAERKERELASIDLAQAPLLQRVRVGALRKLVYGAYCLCALDDVGLPLALIARNTWNPF